MVPTGLLAVYSGVSVAFHFLFVLVKLLPRIYCSNSSAYVLLIETMTWSVLLCLLLSNKFSGDPFVRRVYVFLPCTVDL